MLVQLARREKMLIFFFFFSVLTPQGCLPLVLMFDIKEDIDVEPQCITALMEQLDVFISIKPKPKQPSKVRQQAAWKLSEGISEARWGEGEGGGSVEQRETDWISVPKPRSSWIVSELLSSINISSRLWRFVCFPLCFVRGRFNKFWSSRRVDAPKKIKKTGRTQQCSTCHVTKPCDTGFIGT